MGIQIKNIGADFILNIIASVLIVGTLQFWVYPHLAGAIDASSYGEILTTLGVMFTISATFGNSLNNLRLIVHAEYRSKSLYGDFNILLMGTIILLTIGTILSSLYLNFSMLELCSYWGIGVLGILRIYLSVEFRIKLNYVKVLFLNSIMSMAYMGGIFLFSLDTQYYSCWYFVFLFAELASNFYLIHETDLLREPMIRTMLFFTTCGRYGNLCYLTLLANLLAFMDRNLVFPVLGGEAVAVFFTATIIGNAIGVLAQPIANVLLSYFSQVDFHMNRCQFWHINLVICVVSIIGYLITLLIVDFAVSSLYPSLYIEAKPYFYIANVISFLGIIGSVAQPAVLRYASLSKQSILQTVYVGTFFVGCYYAASEYGLMGFCYASAIFASLRICILWYLGHTVLRGT